MNDKRRKKLIKIYDDNYKEWNYSYNIEDYVNELNKIYEKYVKSESVAQEAEKWIKLFYAKHEIVYLGVAEALRSGDYRHIDNAMYTYVNVFLTVNRTLDSGYDHCISAWNLMPILFCANRFEVIEKICPKECGLSKNGMSFLVTATNLIMYLYYNVEEWRDVVINNTEKYLLKKNSMEDRAVVAALYALAKKDFDEFSKELANICEGRKKSRLYDENKFSKEFSFYSLGLCNFARYLYHEEAEKIILPDNDNFLTDYHMYQSANNYPKGDYIINFGDSLLSLKRLLDTDTPQLSLIKSGRVFVTDTKTYKQQILKNFDLPK